MKAKLKRLLKQACFRETEAIVCSPLSVANPTQPDNADSVSIAPLSKVKLVIGNNELIESSSRGCVAAHCSTLLSAQTPERAETIAS